MRENWLLMLLFSFFQKWECAWQVNMTDEWSFWQVKSGCCPLTGHYFEPCDWNHGLPTPSQLTRLLKTVALVIHRLNATSLIRLQSWGCRRAMPHLSNSSMYGGQWKSFIRMYGSWGLAYNMFIRSYWEKLFVVWNVFIFTHFHPPALWMSIQMILLEDSGFRK